MACDWHPASRLKSNRIIKVTSQIYDRQSPSVVLSLWCMKWNRYIIPALLLAGCATTNPLTTEQKFKRADKDGNGSVSRKEATDLLISHAFEMYDTNRDGYVTEKEYVASGGSAENFRKVNQSGSGKISLAEAQAHPLVFNIFAVSFREADTNKDGQVTLAEYQNYLARRDAAVR
jgi:Ca2+-binding EF-hand superfamily protein